jgi:adenosylmethionine-8-amino-7-oxononanoate aminotransferase
MFACDYLIYKPDLICLSKGLTGGTLPLGITTCSDKVVNQFSKNTLETTFYHGHSFTANPISCAAALASLEILTSMDCVKSIEQISEFHSDFIKKNTFNLLVNLRQRGTILALDVITPEVSSYQNPVRKKIYDFFIQRNILLRPLGNTIYILPPYIITKSELLSIYNAIKEFESTMKQQ